MRPPNADLGKCEQVCDGKLGIWGEREAAPAESVSMLAPASGNAGFGGEVPSACLPIAAGRLAGDTTVETTEFKNVAAKLAVAFERVGDAGELKDEQRGRDIPQPEQGRGNDANLVIDVMSNPVCREESHRGAASWFGPGH
jgi:hypothetical protein